MKVSLPQEEKLSFKDWIAEHYMALFWIGFFIAIGLIMVSQWDKMIDNWNEDKKQIERINELNRQQNSILRFSDDCKELQQAINAQLSGGANTDSWFPDYDDKVTKIGQDRYEILGCKP